MRKVIFTGLLLITIASVAQKPKSVPVAKATAGTLKKVLELQMPLTAEDDMSGSNGASVAWNPKEKKYYAAFAGNKDYPLAVFDAKGKRLSSDSLKCMVDIRGLWYDSTTTNICGNAYSDIGYFQYLNKKNGIPTEEVDIYLEGMYQPDDQSVAAYNSKKQELLFIKESYVVNYMDFIGEPAGDTIPIYWSRTAKQGVPADQDMSIIPEVYNTTTVVYTGIKEAELGFLNTEKRQIELYNYATGFMSKTIKLPVTASVTQSFGFAYTNGIYWLWNLDKRKWVGYK